MKSAVKKYLFMLSIICIAITCIATIGYADFIFNTDDVSNGIGDSSNTIAQTADPIRQNAVFGEAGDASASGTQYYDVYFMAQQVEGGVYHNNDSSMNYYYREVFDGYSGYSETTPNPVMNQDGYAHFGAFYDGNMDLPSDTTLNENRYFKKLENVAELSIDQIEQIGQPRTNKIFDSQSYLSNDRSHMYSLYFLCWTTSICPIYSLIQVEDRWILPDKKIYIDWPNSEIAYVRDNDTSNSPKYEFNGNDGYSQNNWNKDLAVQGYYPSRKSNFSALYTNTLLSIYDDDSYDANEEKLDENSDGDAVFLINGKKTIFIYPVYTSGKNYIAQDADVDDNNNPYDIDNTVDSVVLGKYDSNNLVDSNTFIYDDSLSIKDSNDSSKILDCFLLSDIVFDENETNYYYNIIVDRTIYRNNWIWNGTKYLITNSGNNNSNPAVSDNQLKGAFTDAFNICIDSGRYNIYLFSINGTSSNSSADINAYIDDIDNLFSNNNIMVYYEQKLDCMIPSNDQRNSRDYYIVYERIYEPRLIGGSTGNVDYRQNTNYVFTRVAPTGVEKNHYILRNVYLDPKNTTDYDYTNNAGTPYKGTINNNEFAIQLLPEDGMNYDQTIIIEPKNLDEKNIPTGWPTLKVSDQNGADNIYPYKSSSILMNSTDKPRLAMTKDTKNAGLYNLYIKVVYSNTDGRMTPSYIEIYAYQFNDIFINVYDGGEESIVHHDKDDNTTNLDETGYIKSSACEWRMINLKLGSNLTYDTPLTHYRENENGVWELIEEADGTAETKSLGGYLEELNANNSCLKELVTGKYITLDNYQEFLIDKNYAFIKCLKP